MRVGRGRQHDPLSGRQLDLGDLQGMIGPAEHLLAQIARLRVAPDRLFGGPRQPFPLALRPQQQARKGQIESAGQPHQDHGGRAHLLALDLADRRLGNARPFCQVRQRPAPHVALESQAASNLGA